MVNGGEKEGLFFDQLVGELVFLKARKSRGRGTEQFFGLCWVA
jgi:hypothetical protein